MFTFSTQRFSKIYRTAATFLSCCLMSGLFGLSASAQSSDELYKGTWQIDTPDQGALIILVKSQGLAAYFWGDNTDRTIYQGTWESAEGSATLVWSDGSRHLISRDSLGYGITYFDASGKERYTAQGQQVPSEVLGQWAKPPTVESEATSDRDKAKRLLRALESRSERYRCGLYICRVRPLRSQHRGRSRGPPGLLGETR
mgnify:CR=1 FL=1